MEIQRNINGIVHKGLVSVCLVLNGILLSLRIPANFVSSVKGVMCIPYVQTSNMYLSIAIKILLCSMVKVIIIKKMTNEENNKTFLKILMRKIWLENLLRFQL